MTKEEKENFQYKTYSEETRSESEAIRFVFFSFFYQFILKMIKLM